MARVNKKIAGSISGALGDLVFRELDNKYFVQTRPTSFIPGTDAASVARRQKFKLAAKLAKIIKSIPVLENAWSFLSSSDKPVFRQLLSANYKRMNPAGLPASLALVPEGGFGMTINELTLSPTEVQIDAAAIGAVAGIKTDVETRMKMVSVICLYNPADESLEPFAFIKPETAPQATVIDAGVVYSIPLSSQDTVKYNQYQSRKAFCVLVTMNTSDDVIHYSETITG